MLIMLVTVLLKSFLTPVCEGGLQNCRAGISVFIYIFIFGNIGSHVLIGSIPSRDLSLECYNSVLLCHIETIWYSSFRFCVVHARLDFDCIKISLYTFLSLPQSAGQNHIIEDSYYNL